MTCINLFLLCKRQRYQEDVEENRAAKRQKYEGNSDAVKASERNRYWNDPAVRLAKRAAERKRYRKGHRTTLPPKRMSWHVVLQWRRKTFMIGGGGGGGSKHKDNYIHENYSST